MNKMKRHLMDWEKIFVNHLFDKRLVTKYGKHLLDSIATD